MPAPSPATLPAGTAAAHADDAAATAAAHAFIAKWQGVEASELSTAQSFFIDLCELLGVPRPHPTPEQSYMFERPITFRHGDGSTSAGRIDCYLRGHFVWESKKLKAGERAAAAGLRSFDDALLRARQQAEDYARALPASEGRPPFVVVVDVGHVIELYAEFSRSGATYTPFPDARSHRIRLAQLADPAIRARLKALWLDPSSLDPARISAKVTRQVAAELAQLARSLEAAGHAPQAVAAFLTRCLFSMFAEDVGLLPHDTPGAPSAPAGLGQSSEGDGAFTRLLRSYREQPQTLVQMLRVFWQGLDAGGFNAAIAAEVLRFNGKLFKGAGEDGYVLPLDASQIDGLLRAARANWTEVEPAIFGTLLERALDPTERHALGAHYTPRAYVERLVLPTVIEPLRADWAHAQAAAVLLAREADTLPDGKRRDAKLEEARAELRRFHHQLCTLRVLDPACGSGNFLYVTLEHLKRLEAEVLDQLQQLGQTQDRLALEGETVTVQQLRGIELNPRAAALAELVLWIGWLQWQVRTRGLASVAEPVVHDYGNIECRDAVLAFDATQPALDAEGQPLTRWDGVSFQTHPVTGERVPDPAARVPVWRYINPRPAQWPPADFIVGNPPFIGDKKLRLALGDGYVDALRTAIDEVPESAEFVMYWWHHAANLVRAGAARRFGLITTNSLRQTFNRRVVQAALAAPRNPLHLACAIPDHPWVDSADGAAVRIAMTVGSAEPVEGRLLTVLDEREGADGEIAVNLAEQRGTIQADLRIGANVVSTQALRANAGLSVNGMMLAGSGFIVTPEQAAALLAASPPAAASNAASPESLIRDYRNGRDLTDRPRGVRVIDAFGLTAEQLRERHPAVFQWLLERVKPERDQNNRPRLREQWWVFAEPRRTLRAALAGLPRYIATVETAKHRIFQFLDASVLPDHRLIAFALDDALHLGVLSSQVHVEWALAAGGTLEDRPVYNKTRCFEPFPFPAEDTGLTPEGAARIRALAEQIDAHRKARQAAHEAVTLTGLYNVLDALRRRQPLSAKDKALHEQGLVAVLQSLHDELDAAVLAAYGWSDLAPIPWADDAAHAAWAETLLQRLVALNQRRAAEEAAGTIRWLRPDFQHPTRRAQATPAAQTDAQAEAQPANPAAPEALQNQEHDQTGSRWGSGVFTQNSPQNTPQAAPPTPQQPPLPATEPAEAAAPGARPWPASLPDQVRAVAEVLAGAAGTPLPLAALEARFKGRGPWKKSLPRILDTLEALGRAQRVRPGEGAGYDAWRG